MTEVSVSSAKSSITVGEPVLVMATAHTAGGQVATAEVDWTADGGTLTAQTDSSALFSAAVAGSYKIKGRGKRNSSLQDSTTISVTQAISPIVSVAVSPSAATLPTGSVQAFVASATRQDGTTLTPAVTWSATGGTISGSGVYTAGSTAGAYRVIAVLQGGTLADTAPVTLTAPTLQAVILTPASAALATGATQQFAVSGQWSNGATTAPAVTYSATGGTITAGGLYTAGATAGSFRVIATQQGGSLADTSAITITAPTLQAVILTPASVSLATGATQQFAVSGQWSNGATTAPAVTYSATGGTITAGGLYTAGATAGSFRVIATQQGGSLADTSAITITAPTLQAVILTPASASLATGATQQFAVSGQWSNGATTAPAVTYSATGGTITAGGLYTAGATAGSFRVIATQQGGSLADTAVVSLSAPPQGTGYPNEPPGLLTPYTITAPQPYTFDVLPRIWNAADGRPWYSVDSHGWVIEAGGGESGDVSRWTIVNDTERGNVLNLELRAGDPGGTSPMGYAMAGFGHDAPLSSDPQSPFVARQLFLGYWVKLGPNWTDPNVAMKHLYFFNSLYDGNWYINLSASSYPYLNGGFQIQHSGMPTYDWYGPGASASRGAWHRYEMYARFNTAPGVSDGVLKVWIDGNLVVNRTNLMLGNQGRDFDWAKFGIITGGGGNPVPANTYVRFDDWYVKVGP